MSPKVGKVSLRLPFQAVRCVCVCVLGPGSQPCESDRAPGVPSVVAFVC